MDSATAYSLVKYVNGNSTRFSASTIRFSERTWVILCDNKAPHTAPCEEPILDIQEYLERLDRRSPVNTELRGLLEAWLETRQEEKSVLWTVNPAASRISPTGSSDSDRPHL
ncbi:MAG: hypothetical protein V4671_12450 [Armatimonadota bacterium]